MVIRKADAQDELAVRACAEDAYQQYVVAIGKNPAPMVADFGAQIAEGCVYVACRGNEVVGFIVFFERDDHMFLENVAVKTVLARQGIGKALIDYCESQTKVLGLTSVVLYTNEKMTANLSMYPHLGYVEFDRRAEAGFNRVYFKKSV